MGGRVKFSLANETVTEAFRYGVDFSDEIIDSSPGQEPNLKSRDNECTPKS